MKLSAAPVVVIGTTFVDLKCFPERELNFKGRNPGKVRFYHGGVGRNVAETIALLGSHVRFSSSVQEGGIGQEVLDRLGQAGVDTSGVGATQASEGMGMWVAILNRDGDLACSLSQMPDVGYLEAAWESHGQRLLDNAGLTVLELDLSVPLAERVLRDAAEQRVPVVGLPGNFTCIRERPSMLESLELFVCNQVEAEELCGEPVASVPAAKRAALAILDRGPRSVVVTMGALGSVMAGPERDPVHIPALPVDVVDTTGAGDSFVAGLSHAMAAGAPLRLAVEAASRVAAWTVSSAESVCLDLPQRIAADPWEGWRKIG